jgi:hypothetical protein
MTSAIWKITVSASWLNQIETWFSILSAKSLKGGSFASVPQLVNHIHSFITAITQTPSPSSGQKASSTRSGSNHVSRSSDSGYSHVRRFKQQAREFLACPSSYSAWPLLGRAGGTIMKRRLIML